MAGWQQSRWPYVGIVLGLAIAIAFAARWLFGLSLWIAVPLALAGIVINGFLAEWEDHRPGGFNNPK